MHFVVHHRIADQERFFSADAEQVAGGGPPGVRGRMFLPTRDHATAFCLWETDSLDALRGYLDQATAGAAENTYYEVDSQYAMGLTEAAAARA